MRITDPMSPGMAAAISCNRCDRSGVCNIKPTQLASHQFFCSLWENTIVTVTRAALDSLIQRESRLHEKVRYLADYGDPDGDLPDLEKALVETEQAIKEAEREWENIAPRDIESEFF